MYKSNFKQLKPVFLPSIRVENNIHKYTRVLMLPIQLEDIESLPNDLAHYKQTVQELIEISPVKTVVGYLTIDEKMVKKGNTLRLKGLHVDGIGADDRPDLCVWSAIGTRHYISNLWDEGEKKWMQGAAGIGGMITVSSPAGCRAWNKDFEGNVKNNGNCEHLRHLFPDLEATVFEADMAYWCNFSCVHESLPMEADTERTFVRLSMPSMAPWYSGYTKNPKGVKPTGCVVGYEFGIYRPREPEVKLNG